MIPLVCCLTCRLPVVCGRIQRDGMYDGESSQAKLNTSVAISNVVEKSFWRGAHDEWHAAISFGRSRYQTHRTRRYESGMLPVADVIGIRPYVSIRYHILHDAAGGMLSQVV